MVWKRVIPSQFGAGCVRENLMQRILCNDSQQSFLFLRVQNLLRVRKVRSKNGVSRCMHHGKSFLAFACSTSTARGRALHAQGIRR